MKKTLIALLALGSVAMADEMTYVGPETTTDWNAASNWENSEPSKEGAHTYAQSGDTINISGANVTWVGTSTYNNPKFNKNTVWNITDGANVTLGTKEVTSTVNSSPRFDGVFNVDKDSAMTVCAAFVYGTNNIFGTVNVKNILNPGENTTINFGESGIINLVSGSANGVEGNNRKLTLGAVLDITAYDPGLTSTVYTVEKRYLLNSESGSGFNPGKYGTLTLVGGTILGDEGTELVNAGTGNVVFSETTDPSSVYTTDTLTASADDFGKYLLGCDAQGIYVQYVKATTPEPATATLSLLALAGLAARRRRK